MAQNMYSTGNKVLTKQGRDNFDRIFKKKKLACDDDCGGNCSCGDSCGDKCSDKPKK